MAGESGALQGVDRFGAAAAHLAMHDGFAGRIDLVHAIEHLAQRNQLGIRNLADLVFMRFTDVDDLDVVAFIKALFQFSSCDFFHSRLGHLWLLSNTAEFFVVD